MNEAAKPKLASAKARPASGQFVPGSQAKAAVASAPTVMLAASSRFLAPVVSAIAPSRGLTIATASSERPVTSPQRAVAAAGASPSASAIARKNGG